MEIPVAGPWITEKEIQLVTEAAGSAWYGSANKYNDQFEKRFAEYTGRSHAIALPSCTSGIHLALLAMGIGKGDEVIVPDITWIATAAPVTYVGARPTFADIDGETWCLSPESFQTTITKKTAAVIPVDLYGGMPDMDAIREIADDHGIGIIEDAAEAIGSEYHGKRSGSFGDVSVFSFHGTKTLTTGEGGMFVTDDKKIYDRCRFLSSHATIPGDKKFWNGEIGYKYKMSGLQASLGLAQLGRIDELVGRKRDIFYQYRKHLPGVTLNYESPDTKNSYWMTTAILPGIHKEGVMAAMKEHGIDTRPFFYPLSSQPAFERLHHDITKTPESYRTSPFGINLPSPMNITDDEIGYICRILREIITNE
jgi:perosamine synthetase